MATELYGTGLQADLLRLAHELSAHEMVFNGLRSAGCINWSSPDKRLGLEPVELANPDGKFKVTAATFSMDSGDTRLTVRNTARQLATLKDNDPFARMFYDAFAAYHAHHILTDHSACEERVRAKREDREARLFAIRSSRSGEIIQE